MRVSNTAPPYCASCFQQKPEETFVDFEAAWDGPTQKVGPEGNTITVAIDDLIICEKCLTVAARLIGLGHVEDLKEENESLGKLVETLNEENARKDRAIRKMTEAQGELQGLELSSGRGPAPAIKRREGQSIVKSA